MVNDTRPIPHGTRNGYSYYKCRCEPCRFAAREYARKRATDRDPSVIPHGTQNGYKHYGCRCDECSEVGRAHARNLRKNEAIPNKPVPHGTLNGYKRYNCRCEACKAAKSKNARNQRANRKPSQAIPHGTANGYTYHKCRCKECTVARSDLMSRWREKNPDYGQQWRGENRERHSDLSRRRRARMRDAFVEDVPRLEIFERDNWQCQIVGCFYPGIPASLDAGRHHPLLASVDHIIPLSKGGKHKRSNLACSHLRCNVSKQARIEGIA